MVRLMNKSLCFALTNDLSSYQECIGESKVMSGWNDPPRLEDVMFELLGFHIDTAHNVSNHTSTLFRASGFSLCLYSLSHAYSLDTERMNTIIQFSCERK